MSIKSKLNRYKKHLQIEEKQTPSLEEKTEKANKATVDVPYLEQWQALGATPLFFDDQYTLLRTVEYPLDHWHGRYQFQQLQEAIERWNEVEASHPLTSKGKEASDLVFFDTETTGLSSGTGNTIFLLGYSRIENKKVIVKQFFLPGPHHEVALYHHFLTDVGNLENLVTYNGKAFDWPQLKTRHTFVRNEVPKLPSFGHFDLLHGSRRLWKEILPSCRLSVVEQDILKFTRTNDTPGYLAPMLYFDFLNEQDPRFVEGVLTHNEWDVLSLMGLYTHLTNQLVDVKTSHVSAKEAYEIGRWYEQFGEVETAYEFYQKAADIEGPVKHQALHAIALLNKKQKKYDKAASTWEHLLERSPYPKPTYAIELAKIYEHQSKDYEKALTYAKMAYQLWGEKERLLKKQENAERLTFIKRIERLTKKIEVRK
ncbi:ribonuclease H-like domain-containing protein [Desertibacillus haloalkaliphilus]|uniref:ribonuclease H-like domain-containing protein n=1 Tax=Desertibacillus haloalkaliphilus TaxID=1328930 RepID=UPI001C269356|nr:ribonuclease H-like domain-containing protein [Desertibacillus haloalkaliphilus]MBU8906049.1 ribonuclease H-like domain-containing protein [Desertibacillus haloalkaliphilus]